MKKKGKGKDSKIVPKDTKIRYNHIPEEPCFVYSDNELENCTVIPRGAFVMFERGYYAEGAQINDHNKISSSSTLQRSGKKECII